VVVEVVVVATGGVPGRTVVVAAVAVVVIVTIFVADGCCSWQIVVMLERCVFAGGRIGGLVLWYESAVPGAVGSVVACSIGDVSHCMGSSSLDTSDVRCRIGGSLSDDSAAHLFSEGRLSPSNLWMSALATPRYGLLMWHHVQVHAKALHIG
jgi:hypothetical protein